MGRGRKAAKLLHGGSLLFLLAAAFPPCLSQNFRTPISGGISKPAEIIIRQWAVPKADAFLSPRPGSGAWIPTSGCSKRSFICLTKVWGWTR